MKMMMKAVKNLKKDPEQKVKNQRKDDNNLFI